MAVHTFSTKGSKPADTQLVKDIKKHCDDEGLNFSAIVIKLLKTYKTKEMSNG